MVNVHELPVPPGALTVSVRAAFPSLSAAPVRAQPSLRAEMGERGYQAFRRMWDRPAHMRLYFDFIRNAALKKLGRVPWEHEVSPGTNRD